MATSGVGLLMELKNLLWDLKPGGMDSWLNLHSSSVLTIPINSVTLMLHLIP